MVEITKEMMTEIGYDLDRITEPCECLFFDIETTGFSADRAFVYLIGCVYQQSGRWWYTQWLAEEQTQEEEVLNAFFAFSESFRYLLHFNGDTFDIPFLTKRADIWGIASPFKQLESLDLYRMIKPFRRQLGLDSCKQKSLERFLNIHREDQFSGGELIPVYLEYEKTGSRRARDLVLLHNADDLAGMLMILPVLNYRDFFDGDFVLEHSCMQEYRTLQGDLRRELYLTYRSKVSVPVPFTANLEHWYMSVKGNVLKLRIALFEGELKHFYPNYRDYYYLTVEDTAIHKSVAEFVNKEYRKKATAKTCYTKHSGIFLPQPSEIITPCFQREYKDKLFFAAYDERLFEDAGRWEQYLHALIGKSV
ncbi:ribonuclease H-like domain-containing protein [Lachnotalea sp. AF33-28]|uniref:ribonuclease H-like domain-containing protein n=1 Tax=Lachnotalea sp. AF33-28 TaxID=2292046 RepID=UPI001314123C|nr:ribonuclease H-like domain-containing protein [Lachnotalea sp. AF33-28]